MSDEIISSYQELKNKYYGKPEGNCQVVDCDEKHTEQITQSINNLHFILKVCKKHAGELR